MVHIDYETFCHIDVREVGAEAYARHPSCEILMLAWAFDDDPVNIWCPDGPWQYDEIPIDLTHEIVCGHNVAFEWNITKHVLGIELLLHNLRDTAALALINGYPKSLAGAGAALGLPIQKDTHGSALIKKFCQLNRGKRTYAFNAPQDWEDFKSYCKQDVIVEREIWHVLAR